MSGRIDRREFIGRSLLGGAGASLFIFGSGPLTRAANASPASKEPFKGIFPVLQTPFKDNEEIDVDVLLKEANFVIEAGGHGMAWPRLGSEFYVLSEDERKSVSKILVEEVRGRLPVIIGVDSTSYWKESLDYAKYAESIGADGIISLPPYAGDPSVEMAAEFFKAIARTVPLPIFIQNSGGRYGPALPTRTMVEIARECPNVAYIKEEASPITHRIGAMVEQGKGAIKAVFGGAGGTTLLNEMRRGAMGSMTGTALVDVWAKIFDGFLAGKEKEVQEMFDKAVAMQMFQRPFWLGSEKEILRRRGIFKNTKLRISPYELKWDTIDQEEFEVIFNNLKPYFSV